MFKSKVFVLFVCFCFCFPILGQADAVPGDMIVTLGENLSSEQRDNLLREMEVPDDVDIIFVSNEEEHHYLGSYISKAQIGSRALSSTKLMLEEPGGGLVVETNKITWVSDAMYSNALITAGVNDATIYVTAPTPVSGTAALTGLVKAYEITTDIEIPEEQKQIANEELVRTGQLAEKIGAEQAAELIARIKEEMADRTLETEEDVQVLIEEIVAEVGVTLSEEEFKQLVGLFYRMKDLNIDWNQIQDHWKTFEENMDEWLQRKETQTFISKFVDVVNRIIDVIKSWIN